MTELAVFTDLNLEHLVTSAVEGNKWHGWRIGGPAARAAVGFSPRFASATGDDRAGRRLNQALLDAGLEPAPLRTGSTNQRFHIAGPAIGLHGHRLVTSRCPVCGFVHATARGGEELREPRAARAGCVMATSIRRDVVRRVERMRPSRGAILVLEDPTPLRFAPVSDTIARISAFDLLIASPQVAAMLARRARTTELSNPLSATTIHVATDGPFNGASDSGTANFLDPTATEAAVQSALADRLGASPAATPRPFLFSEPVTIAVDEARRGRPCPLCDARVTGERANSTVRKASKVGARHNLGWLRRRTLAAADNVHGIIAAETLLSWKGTAFVVASGGSAIASAYIAQLLRERSGLFATEAFPSDYVATGSATDAVVLVSFSGGTADHLPVIRRAQALGVKRIALVCRPPVPALASELGPGGLVVAYGSARRQSKSERGFVSMAATTAPCALLLAAAEGPSALLPLASAALVDDPWRTGETLGTAILDGQEVHVLGSGYARAAMLDLESKWAEGDLGPLTVHQSKDFSHGRFMSVLGSGRRAIPVMLSVGDDAYESEVLAILEQEHRDSSGNLGRPLRLRTTRAGLVGALDLLLGVQEMATATAGLLGRDLSRPERIDPEGLRLYRWPAAVDEIAPSLERFPR